MRFLGRLVRSIGKAISYVAAPLVGFATGNPWLVGSTAFACSAARGENLQQSLMNGVLSGTLAYAGSTVSSKLASGASGGFLQTATQKAMEATGKLIPSFIANGANAVISGTAGLFGTAVANSAGSALGAILGHKLSHPDMPKMPAIQDYSSMGGGLDYKSLSLDNILRDISEKANVATHQVMLDSPRETLTKLEAGKNRFELYEEEEKENKTPKLSLKELYELDIPEENSFKKANKPTFFPTKKSEIDIFNYRKYHPTIKEISKRQQKRISMGLKPN